MSSQNVVEALTLYAVHVCHLSEGIKLTIVLSLQIIVRLWFLMLFCFLQSPTLKDFEIAIIDLFIKMRLRRTRK